MTSEPVLDQRGIASVLAASVAAELGLAAHQHVDRAATFADLGLDSAALVTLAGTASAELGVEIPTEWLFDHPTVDSLAAFLAETVGTPEPARG
ncbi:hypothetical protein GCM10009801_19030 [Streptomyces albiaxialis]|uniref:Carrier domain-containing protein n=1 Tax=Streptomyces albiaxialis TaxID=329523 RepID=A0ABN2VQN3_9ACTN